MLSYSKVFIFGLLLPMVLIACSENENKTENTNKFEILDAKAFNKMLEDNDEIQLIDVRTPEEFQSGHIVNANNINIYDSNFENEISKLDKEKPVLVYCRSGGRSSTASNRLKDLGYKFVYDLEGGITSWNDNNYEVTTAYSGGNSTNSLSDKKYNNSISNPNENSSKGLSLQKYNDIISNSNKLVLVDFNAEWCAPCKKLSPILEKLAKEYDTKLELVKIDVDNNPLIAKELKVQGLPTLKLYKNGVEVWENLGLTDEITIVSVLNKHN